MNTVASEPHLFRQLALTPYTWFQVAFCLFATYYSMISDGWVYWVYPLFVFIFLVNVRVEWGNYRAVGMTLGHWRRHRRILVSAIAGFMLVEVAVLVSLGDLPVNPVFIVAMLGGLGWVLVSRAEPSRNMEEIVEGAGAVEKAGTERSRFPLTPVQQIIRGPQVIMWSLVWGMVGFLILVLAVLDWFFGAAPGWVSVVFAVVGLHALWWTTGSVGNSLREWVAFGGNRAVWARETAVLGLLSPLFAGLIAVVTGAFSSTDAVLEVLPVFLGTAFLVPILFTLVELTDLGRTWWVSLPYVGVSAGLIALWLTHSVGEWGFLAGCAVLYLIHALTLPMVTRNYTVFTGGVSAWLGLRTVGKV